MSPDPTPDSPSRPRWLEALQASLQQTLSGTVTFIVVAVSFLVVLPNIVGWFERFELYTLDERQRLIRENREHVSPISLIEVDEKSLSSAEMKRLFDRYPHRREVFAYLVRFLERGGAERLIMDMAFTGGPDLDHPESDQAFAQATFGNLKVTSNLSTLRMLDPEETLPAAQQQLLLQALSDQWVFFRGPMFTQWLGFKTPIVSASQAPYAQPSLEVLMESPMAFYPFENLLYDNNGKARRSILFTQLSTHGILPTLPVSPLLDQKRQIALTADGRIHLGDHWVNTRGEPTPIIRWYGNALDMDQAKTEAERQKLQVYPRYSFWKVIKSQLYHDCQQPTAPALCKTISFQKFTPLDPTVFKGRYVFIGLNSISYDMDNHASLYDLNGRKYPGVIIQANILDNLLHDDFIGRSGWRVPMPDPLANWLKVPNVSLVTVLTVLAMIGLGIRFAHWGSITLSVLSLVVLGVFYHYFCQLAYIKWNLWVNWIYPMTALGLSFTGAFIYRFVEAEKKKQQLRIAFGKYFPKEIMDEILKNPDKITLGGQRLTMTFLFCDIRGFTTFAEQNDTGLVQQVLNDYYTAMHDISRAQKGTAFKFLGDGILTFWGFPSQRAEDPLLAVKAAWAMKQAVEVWDADPSRPPIQIGIGINSGEAFFGNVGTEQYMDFTVIGDSVNTASRLQDLNKQYGTTIILSEATYQQVKESVSVRPLGQTTIRGKAEPIEIYELLNLTAGESATALAPSAAPV